MAVCVRIPSCTPDGYVWLSVLGFQAVHLHGYVWLSVLGSQAVHLIAMCGCLLQAECVSLPGRGDEAGAEAVCEGFHTNGQGVEAQLWRLSELVCGI